MRTLVATPDPPDRDAMRRQVSYLMREHLDGTLASAVSLLTGLSRQRLGELGGTGGGCWPCGEGDHVMCLWYYDGCCCEGDSRFTD